MTTCTRCKKKVKPLYQIETLTTLNMLCPECVCAFIGKLFCAGRFTVTEMKDFCEGKETLT